MNNNDSNVIRPPPPLHFLFFLKSVHHNKIENCNYYRHADSSKWSYRCRWQEANETSSVILQNYTASLSYSPDTPQSPHPDWIVRKLPKPECIENPSGELVWVFYCFYHKRTYKTEWFPPPPPPAIPYKDSGEDDSGSVDDDDDDDDNNEDGVIDLVDEEEDEHPSKRRKGIEAVLR